MSVFAFSYCILVCPVFFLESYPFLKRKWKWNESGVEDWLWIVRRSRGLGKLWSGCIVWEKNTFSIKGLFDIYFSHFFKIKITNVKNNLKTAKRQLILNAN